MFIELVKYEFVPAEAELSETQGLLDGASLRLLFHIQVRSDRVRSPGSKETVTFSCFGRLLDVNSASNP